MKQANKTVVIEYSANWPIVFESLQKVYEKFLKGLIKDIHHVGSTAVPGLAAKPVIDIDLVIENSDLLDQVILKLENLGYTYEGDLGIEHRWAFKRTSDKTPLDGSNNIWPKHNLYCCTRDSVSLRNHLQFRNYLRKNPEKVTEYSELKKKLALQHPFDIDFYTEHKTPFITKILKETGFDNGELEAITEQNRKNFRVK